MKCEICNKRIWFLQSYTYTTDIQTGYLLGRYHTKCFDKERAKEWKRCAELRGKKCVEKY